MVCLDRDLLQIVLGALPCNRGGDDDVDQELGFLPLIDYFVPEAHARGSDFPGCLQFSFGVSDGGNTFRPNSVRLDLLARECRNSPRFLFEAISGTSMSTTGGSEYHASGDGFDVTLTLTDPLAGPGGWLGFCQVNEYNQFNVFRGTTCSADVQSYPPV